jgi:hypothetical protein
MQTNTTATPGTILAIDLGKYKALTGHLPRSRHP